MSRAALSLSCLCWATLVGIAAAQPSLDPGDPGMASLQDFSGGATFGGTYFSISNVTGDGVGYKHGYTQFGLVAPYWINEDTVLAGNGRLTIGDSITIGANLGGFLRYHDTGTDRIWGLNAFFDLDESVRNNEYQQFGFGVETLGQFLDFRANGYAPTSGGGDNFVTPIGLLNNNPIYWEHRVGFLGLAAYEESLTGGDFEFGTPVSPQATWLRAYAGGYAYQSKGEDPVGFRGRLEGWVSDDLSLGVQVTDDAQFGTNVNAQVNFLFSGWRPTRWFPNFATRERMLSPVQRNNRIATGSYNQVVNVPLINPRTDQPYFLTWVDNSNIGGGDGTVENPLPFMPPVAPEADLILVRLGISSPATPVLGSIQLLDWQRLLGEGREHTIRGYVDFGHIQVPTQTYNLPGFVNTGIYPFVTSATSIVTLADHNEVSAFTFFNSGGAAITNTALGSEDFNINYVNMSDNAGGGIALTQASGDGFINHVNALNNAAGGIALDSGVTPLFLDMFRVTSDSSPQGVQAFGISINADNGAIIADMRNIRTDDNDAGIILAETNSSLIATLTNIRTRGNAPGDGILATGVGGVLDLTLDNVLTTGNAGRGVFVTGDNTDIAFTQTDLDARGNTNNNVEFALINSSTLFGGLANLDVSNSVAGSGLVLGAHSNSQIGTLADPYALVNVTSDNNGMHGLDVQVTTQADVVLTAFNSDFNNNTLDGFHFDVAAEGVLRVGFVTVDLDDNLRSAVLGTVAGDSTADLEMTNVTGQRSGENGLFVTSTTGSNAFVDLTDSDFSDSGQVGAPFGFSGVRVDATDSNVDVNLLRVISGNTVAFPAGSQDLGLQLNFAGATQFAASVTDSTLEDNFVDGALITVAGTSNGQIGFDGTSSSNNGRHGLNVAASGAAVVALDTTDSLFDGNGLGRAGSGMNLDVDAAQLTLTGLNSSFSGNGEDGITGLFDNGADVVITTWEEITADDNEVHGLNLVATGAGTTLNANINGGSFSDNGAGGLFDGVHAEVLSGAFGLLCFDGTEANDNTDDGYDFLGDGAGTELYVLLQTSGNFGTLTANGNGDQAVEFELTGGASGALLMDGPNDFSGNGAATPIVFTATSAAMAAFQFSGNSSNNAGHGLQVNMTDIIQAWLDIHDAVLDGNGLSGAEINLDNVTFATAPITISFLQGDFVAQPFQIVDSDISGNGDFGIEFNGIDVRMPFQGFNARHIDGNTVDGNDLDNIFVSLDSIAFTTDIVALNISNNSVSNSVNGSGLRVEIAGDNTTIGRLPGFFSPLRGLTANNNIADGNDDYGVHVSVEDAALVRLIRINNTTGNAVDWSASNNGLDGVFVQADIAGTPTINNIEINGNGTATNNGGLGINVVLTDVLGLPTISIDGAPLGGGSGNREVNDNGAPGIGNTLVNTPFTSVTIANNIVDPNVGGGIITSFDASPGDAITITDNTVLANLGNGIGVTLINGSDVTTIDILRNDVEENDGNGIDLVSADSWITTLNVNNNVVGLNTGHGVALDLDATLVTTLNITDNAIGSEVSGGGGGLSIIDDSLPLIRPGFDQFNLVGLDVSTPLVPIGFNGNFYGINFNEVFVNMHGNVTLNQPLPFQFTPLPIITNGIPMFAPFWADTDGRPPGNPLTYGTGTVGGQAAFGVNWIDMRHYDVTATGAGTTTNTFQLVMIDRSDIAPGDFDFEFNYTDINWEAGTGQPPLSSGGDNDGIWVGPGGGPARAGWTNGVDQSFELAGSGVPGAFLNSGPAGTSLIQNSLNSVNPGRYIFSVRNGAIGAPSALGGPNGIDGVHIEMDNSAIDTANITANEISNNLDDGIHIDAADSSIATLNITENGINANVNHGINISLDTATITDFNVLDNSQGINTLVGLDFQIIGNTFSQPYDITNTSGPGINITDFQIDLTGSGNVWDTEEPGGSTPFSGAAPTDTDTGLTTVNGNPYPNALPSGGVPDDQPVLDLSFSDFNPGETFTWNIDVDVAGAGATTVLGSDLVNSAITVNFTGGLFLSGTLQPFDVDGNGSFDDEASQFVASGGNVTTPGISSNGLDGVHFELVDGSAIGTLDFDANTINGNGDDGVDFAVVDASTIGPVVFSDNSITENTNDGVRVVQPDTSDDTLDFTFTGTVDAGISTQNISANGGNGVNFDLDGAEGLTLNVTGTTFEGNTGMGVRLALTDNAGYNATIGDSSPGAAGANTFSTNGDAGMGIIMIGASTGVLVVENSSFTANIDAADANFAGVGLGISLVDTATMDTAGLAITLGDAVEKDTFFNNNPSHGFFLNADAASFVQDVLVQNAAANENGGDGLNFAREGNATITDVLITDSTFQDNTSDGIDITSGTRDDALDPPPGASVYTIQDSEILSNTGNGIRLFNIADSDLNVTVTGNTINENGVDGIFAGFNSDVTDTPTLVLDVIDNTISDNGTNGIRITSSHLATFDTNIITGNGQDGINISGGSLSFTPDEITNNTITGNGDDGIDISSGFIVADIHDNVAISGNVDDGLAFTNAGGTQVIAVDNNPIQNNGSDGIQISATSGAGSTILPNVYDITNNDIRGSVRRGINVVNAGGTNALGGGNPTVTTLNIAGNTIALSQLEAIYVINTASNTQGSAANINNLASTALLADGSVFAQPLLDLTIDSNVVDSNGQTLSAGDFIGSSGIVLRVGTSDASNSFTDAGGFASGGRGGVVAAITDNLYAGQFGADVTFQPFISTVNPATTTGTWTDQNENPRDDTNNVFVVNPGYQSDPLARLDLTFTGNTGDGLLATHPSAATAFYNNNEAQFKSRGITGVSSDTTNDGPPPDDFGPFNTGTRARNATRLAFRGTLPPTIAEGSTFLYPGIAANNTPLDPLNGSTFRVNSSGNTFTTVFSGFGASVPIGGDFGEVPFIWGDLP